MQGRGESLEIRRRRLLSPGRNQAITHEMAIDIQAKALGDGGQGKLWIDPQLLLDVRIELPVLHRGSKKCLALRTLQYTASC